MPGIVKLPCLESAWKTPVPGICLVLGRTTKLRLRWQCEHKRVARMKRLGYSRYRKRLYRDNCMHQGSLSLTVSGSCGKDPLGDGSKCRRGKGLKTVCLGPTRTSDSFPISPKSLHSLQIPSRGADIGGMRTSGADGFGAGAPTCIAVEHLPKVIRRQVYYESESSCQVPIHPDLF